MSLACPCPVCAKIIRVPDRPSMNEFGDVWIDDGHFGRFVSAPVQVMIGNEPLALLAIYCTVAIPCECVAVPYGRCIVTGPHRMHMNADGVAWPDSGITV
jgi:hypothetical protein